MVTSRPQVNAARSASRPRVGRAGRPSYPGPTDRPLARHHAMKFAAALLLLLCFAAAAARADLVIVQRVEGGGMEGEMTIRLQGKRVRADIAPGISTIVDGAKGETIVLQHKTKIFNRIDAEQTKALAEQLLTAQAGSAPGKLTPTNEKKEVAGHQTQAYHWVVGQMKMKFWVCTDFANADAIQQQLNALQSVGLAPIAASLMPDPRQMPGLRLRTEFEMGGSKVATTIQSIKQEPVDATIFDVPKGYREVALPVTGAGQPGK